jgi:hypothetical protein
MRDQRLIHDAAWSMAQDVLRSLGPVLTDDEKVAVFPTAYRSLVDGLTAFVTKRDREWQRLNRRPTEAETAPHEMAEPTIPHERNGSC